jgi:mRNA interferase MazF
VKRGEIWTASAGGAYVGKPRPVAIVQDDRFGGTASITVCAFTTDPTEAPLLRLRIEPSQTNGLREVSSLMVDKITTVSRDKLGERIGRLADEDVVRLNRALMLFLGLAG